MSFAAVDPLIAAGVDQRRLREIMPRVVPQRVRVYSAPRWFYRLWFEGIVGLALPWGIYLAPSAYGKPAADLASLTIHELMHIEQWRRLGGLRHIAQYVGDYLRGRRRGLNHWDAYCAVRLEVEARAAVHHVLGAT